MAKNFIFVDEAGDPGQPFTIDKNGNKVPTGASPFYIIVAICMNDYKLFQLEHRMMEEKIKYGYKKEIKSNEISLNLYSDLLKIVNELDIKTYYRLIDKNTYKGKFKVDGIPSLHNVFDEYNVARAIAFALVENDLKEVDIVIDRTDRRRFNGKFDSFNEYLTQKVKKYIAGKDPQSNRINHVTHVDSQYVNAMQMSDIVSGAIRDNFTKKNTALLKVIDTDKLILADGKYESKPKKGLRNKI